MRRSVERQPATKGDLAAVAEDLGGRIGRLEERLDGVERELERHGGTLQSHSEMLEAQSRLLTHIGRAVSRIEEKLTDPGGLIERVGKLEARVTAVERATQKSR